jgi:GST-like protein
MIDLHYWTTPNGHKVTMFLEEAGMEYRLIPVNISKGEQFTPDFLAIAPNNRIPAIVDHAPAGGGAPVSLFESGAILLYLADKIGRFVPPPSAVHARAERCNGCSGRWAALAPWPGRTTISASTRRRRSPTPSRAM